MRRARLAALLLALGMVAGACSVHRLDDSELSTGVDRTGAAAGPASRGADGAVATSDGNGPSDGTAAGTGPAGGGRTAGAGGAAIDDAPAARAPTANVTGGTEARTASDRGVTEDEIRLGILHTADTFFAATGSSTKSVDQVIAPFIAELNAGGGINGRTVVPRISTYDPLSPDSMKAACVEQAEDHQVFASIAQVGFYGDAEICMATKEVPLLTNNNSTAKTNVERERGWVRQTNQNKDRNIKNWIDWMIDTGLLRPDVRTGVLFVDVPEDRDLVNEVVLPYLRSKGMPSPVVATLSSSIAQTPAEAQAAVLRFNSERVQLVLPFVSFLRMLIFTQQADAFSYRPQYSVSDFGLLATDAMAGMPPSQWEGVTGITVLPTGIDPPGELPSSPAFRECHDAYRRHGGELAPHPDDPARKDGVEVANMMHYCQHIALWADVARRAGLNPTRRSFLTAVDETGTWSHRVTLSERLTFGPGKLDGADLYAVVRWQPRCTSDGGCYRQIEGFRAGRW